MKRQRDKKPEESLQGPAMPAPPQKEHLWLHKFLGEWTFEGIATMEPGQAPVEFRGSEKVRALGEIWILAEGQGEMPGCGTATTLMTLGYDPQKKRFLGTWVGSMMTHLWVYDGTLDAGGAVLTLNTLGPDQEGKLVKFMDVIEFKSADHRVLTSHLLGGDGAWFGFMTANYRRRK
jgi:hypothetical protein